MKSMDRSLPRPSYMTKEQQGEYLKQLRSRPVGSRPLPESRSTPTTNGTAHRASQATTFDQPKFPPNSATQMPSRVHNRSPFAGRALARPPSPHQTTPSVVPASISRRTSGIYVERGTRWMEKQETKSLRMALEDMDLKDEQRIFSAARDEAAELVLQHQHRAESPMDPYTPYKNEDGCRDYRSHLRKGSYQRSHSSQDLFAQGAKEPGKPNIQDTAGEEAVSDRAAPRQVTRPPTILGPVKKLRSTSGVKYDDLAGAVASDIEQARRRSSGGNRRIMSGEKKMFMNPNDRIWEDPSEDSNLRSKAVESSKEANSVKRSPSLIRKNPFARVRMQHERLERTNSAPDLHVVKPLESKDQPCTSLVSSMEVTEIRSKEIRSATSKSRHDRSPNLPRPTLVSDRPGRPIVSFTAEPAKKEFVLQGVQSTPSDTPSRKPAFNPEPMKMPLPRPQFSHAPSTTPSIPVLSFPDEHDVPSIVLSSEPSEISSSAAAPSRSHVDTPTTHDGGIRPTPQHSISSPLPKSLAHYTPILRPTGTLCAHCALPIAGRILSAAGQRFHPKCFVCYSCHTNLELVAFYPEPEQRREERITRIRDGDDGDDGLRFYCHLDFHELFSPRCKSCKTPIEGEVVVACGAEWHVGHFFCAQCGDPFDSTTPFVEKDGYAWCVGCHTHRYSNKCRKCRKPVIDVVVKALDSDWHESCFVCSECQGPFEDGRYFLRGHDQDPVCVGCEERRLKA